MGIAFQIDGVVVLVTDAVHLRAQS